MLSEVSRNSPWDILQNLLNFKLVLTLLKGELGEGGKTCRLLSVVIKEILNPFTFIMHPPPQPDVI